MVEVFCRWCGKKFKAMVGKTDEGERSQLVCQHCASPVNSSIKIATGNLIGAKHFHRELEEGDIA